MNKRIPSLDGVRAVAIFCVIALHIGQHCGWPTPGTLAFRVLVGRSGAIWTGDGVGIFFVLSGYLITSLLVREFDRSGRIALRSFYLRRVFRILPPLLAYLGFALAFCKYEHVPFAVQNFTSALFFYRDYYFATDLWLTQHTWSLSVEEQFYVLWPVALLLLLRYKGRRSAGWFVAALIVLTPVLRILGSKVVPSIAHEELYMLHSRMDALMSGCFVALCAGLPRFEAVYQKIAKVWWILPLEFWVISPLLGHLMGIVYRKSIGMTLDSMVMAFLILWTTRNAGHWVGRILNCRFMTQAGILSYSAYLWQTFFLHESNRTWSGRIPYSLLYIGIAAWVSYKLVELPSLGLRDKLMRRQSMKDLSRKVLAEKREIAAV